MEWEEVGISLLVSGGEANEYQKVVAATEAADEEGMDVLEEGSLIDCKYRISTHSQLPGFWHLLR